MTDAALNESIESEVAVKKSSPQNFTESERRSIVQLYDLFECKATSMSVIHSIDGYETMPERKVKRWKIGMEEMVPRVPGKPISLEFEQEVMMECQKTDSKDFKKSSATNGYTYSLVRLCAQQVMNKDYWDADSASFVQKWRRDKRTCGLLFTNKWVSGVLRRWKEYCISTADKGPIAVAELPAAAAHDSRPTEEFEADVVAECVRCGVASIGSWDGSFAFSMVSQCANKVLHAEYWDDRSESHSQKWLLQGICSMQFTRDWIADILRQAVQQQLCTQFHEAEAVDTTAPPHVPDRGQGQGPPLLSQSELNRYFDIDEDSLDGHYYMLIGLITG